MEEKSINCPLCGEPMARQLLPGSKDCFYECPACRAEVWPYDASVEAEARKLMAPSAPRKRRGSGGRRRSRFKARKPGEKYVPWYHRA